ncbi:MAG: hypothetical protein AMXMBFR64_59940 [Myxococcales bacterium]
MSRDPLAPLAYLPARLVLRVAGAAKLRERWGPCPACKAPRVSQTDLRRPVWTEGGTWGCDACGAWGDAVDLAAWYATGRPAAWRERDVDPKAVAATLAWARDVGLLLGIVR